MLNGELRHGDVVDGRFEVELWAGVGGMGRVYRCIDRTNGQKVALKVMSIVGQDHVRRFAREARLLAQLKHRAIVRYVTHGMLGSNNPFLVMEWVEGQSLEEYLSSGSPLSVRQTLSFGRRLAEALAEAHAHGVVHRDIKPGNVLLAGDKLEQAKLLDFGLARDVDTEHSITATGALLGTPAYMAPEQARQADELDARCDVFALGCILYECLAGRRTFQGPNMISVLCKIMLEEPAPLSELRPGVPNAVSELVARMLAKVPEDRLADGGAVLAALDEVSLGVGVSEAPPRTLGHHEQRFLSLILAGWPEQEEPSSMPTVAAAARNLNGMRQAVEDMESQVERMVNGSLVVTVDGTGTAADRAERAARCALRMRESMPNVPVVLATGRGFLNAKLPVGDVIDVAARLLAHPQAVTAGKQALPVLVDPVTASLLRARFDVRLFRGANQLQGVRKTGIAPRKLLGQVTQCVGRKSELTTLQAVWDECTEDDVPAGVLISGPPGIGKSRLTAELLSRLADGEHPPRVLLVRGDPLGVGGAFGMLGRLVASAMDIHDNDSPSAARAKLHSDIIARVPPSEVRRVEDFLGEMLGLSPTRVEGAVSDQVRAAQVDPALKADQIRRAFSDWLLAECEVRPVVMVLEDLQWADSPTLDMLHAVLGTVQDAPFMVIGLARPELDQRTPPVWADRSVTTLRLGPLRKKVAMKFVRSMLGDVEEATAERMVDHSGGNPFFLEELIRAQAAGRDSGAPETVLAVLQASLDELPASLRVVLRAAAVFGETFWQSALRPMLGRDASDLSARIGALVEQEMLVAHQSDRFAGEPEYRFAQGLWRDAAYATLTEDDRRLGHTLAAEWLAERSPSGAQTIALHYTAAELPAQAAPWYARSCEQALRGGDHAAALDRSALALEHLEGAERGQVLAVQAEAHKWRGENEPAEAAALQALDLLPPDAATWFLAAGEATAAAGKLGHADTLDALGSKLALHPPADDEARSARLVAGARAVSQLVLAGRLAAADDLAEVLELSSQEQDPAAAGWVLEARAIRAGSADDAAGRVRMAQSAAGAFERAGDLRNACLQQTSAGFAFNEIGDYQAARAALLQAVELGETLQLANAVATARAQLGRAYSRCGEPEAAERTLTTAIRELKDQGNRRLQGVGTSYLAWLLLERGRLQEAEQRAREAVELLQAAPPLRASADATLAQVLLSRGESEEAARVAEAGAALLAKVGKVPTGEGVVRLSQIEALLAIGQQQQAALVASEAKRRLLERARRIEDESLRESFLQIEEHARTLKLAG